MVKVGDILEFQKPIYQWHEKYLLNGAKYIAGHFRKYRFFKTPDGETQIEELPEYDNLRVFLKVRNGNFDCGYLADFNNYKVIGNIND